MEEQYYFDEIDCPIRKKQKPKKGTKELSNLRRVWRVYLHDK